MNDPAEWARKQIRAGEVATMGFGGWVIKGWLRERGRQETHKPRTKGEKNFTWK